MALLHLLLALCLLLHLILNRFSLFLSLPTPKDHILDQTHPTRLGVEPNPDMDSGMVAMKTSSEKQLCFKTLSFNGKRDRHETTPFSYMECQKNRAAATGGHALDGCGEFMPLPYSSLSCAACGCHRNFHRIETVPAARGMGNRTAGGAVIRTQRFSPASRSNSSSPSLSEAPISSFYPSAPQILLTLSSGMEISAHTPTIVTTTTTRTTPGDGKSEKARKRFRTKFSTEQKEKMRKFAEGYGWKMQRSDDEVVRKFCDEIGVCKTVLKVWMPNNKSRNTMGFSGYVNYEYNGGGMRVGFEEIHVAGNNGGKQSTDGGSASSV